MVYLGWERNLMQYVIYGRSVGNKEALATTEAIMEATEEEINGDPVMPTIIQGAFNEVPANSKLSKE